MILEELIIFGGDVPEFADEVEAKAILGAIMGRSANAARPIERELIKARTDEGRKRAQRLINGRRP